MPLPKISIITPSYNQGQYIEQTINSVLDQNYPELEYIIIDGGSTDQSVDIIKKYSKYLAYWISEKDNGQSDAINKGLLKCTGDIVNWLNSDDYYQPGCLHHIAEVFMDQSISCYSGKSRVFSEQSETFTNGTDVYKDNYIKTMGWARIDQPETFFRKKVWDDIGVLNTNCHFIMDKEWWLRYLITNGIGGIYKDDKVLVNFRIHENSKTGSQKEKFLKETIDLYYSICIQNNFNELIQFFEANFPVNRIHLSDVYKNHLSKSVVNYFIFYLFSYFYSINDFAKAKSIKPYVDVDVLSDTDKKEFSKISFRLNIPISLKRLYNRFT
jgi:Glycosyltransferases involved in cell wall biogenesis